MVKSTKTPAIRKPAKPYASFPLTAHNSGRWCKVVKGRRHYFGRWAKSVEGQLTPVDGDGWREALDEYERTIGDLAAGRKPRPKDSPTGPTVAEVCHEFMEAKERAVLAGDLSQRSLGEYHEAVKLIVAAFGPNREIADLRPTDFADLGATFAKNWGPARRAKFIQMTRSVFKYGFDADIIDRPVKFGPEFRMPSASVKRRHKATKEIETAGRTFGADECRKLICDAPLPLRAMILLGLNCAYGNHDIATLPLSAVDLDRGVVTFPRPKTGINRRCPLWSETVAALREWIEARPAPQSADVAGLVFLSVRGRSLLTANAASPIAHAFTNHGKAVGVRRPGLGFYSLRHTHRTIADDVKDQPAAALVMGHVVKDISDSYRHGIADRRLRAITDHVRHWLWPADCDQNMRRA